MPLTGDADGPPARCGHAVPSCARGALHAFHLLTGAAGAADGALLLAERCALNGRRRRGAVSANGTCRLYTTADDVLALNLARPDDRALLPAWLGTEAGPGNDDWLAAQLRRRGSAELLARGRLLGLPVAPANATSAPPEAWFRLAQECTVTPRTPAQRPLVVDLSALWAGPLCASLLRAAGARVIKVESRARLDGARGGDAHFYNLLNGGKESVVFDFATAAGRDALRALLCRADIVIDSARPRALRQLGIDAGELLAGRAGALWVSITGYGREAPRDNWVAFGDDAAAAAGLLYPPAHPGALPAFCGDALCDPLAGLHAAVAAAACWQRGRGGMLALNLHDVGARCGAFYTSVDPGEVARHGAQWSLRLGEHRFPVSAPRARMANTLAREPGADTQRVCAEMKLPGRHAC